MPHSHEPLSKPLSERVAREHEAHTERDVLAESVRLKSKFPHLATYPSKLRLYATIDRYVRDLKGKTILDYGCGRGEMAMKYLRNGADKVAAIDISEVYVADLQRQADAAGFAPERCDFRAMDAHRLDFPDQVFDLVVGYGILCPSTAENGLALFHFPSAGRRPKMLIP